MIIMGIFLETKNLILEEENIKFNKNLKNANEKIIELELFKIKSDDLKNELKYKESIIHYLENILKINKSI